MVPDNNTVTYDPSNQDSSLKFEDLGSVPDLTDDGNEETDNSGIIAAAVIVPLIVIGLIILVTYIVIK